MVQTGLEQIATGQSKPQWMKAPFGLLCHAASVDSNYTIAPEIFNRTSPSMFQKIFGPQHGMMADVQDNMIETEDFFHPYFKRPVYSLYGETRIPTDKMLEGIETLVVDLQDVGCRVYTYIWTLALAMEACARKKIRVVVLDRPNPLGGIEVEGNVLDPQWSSFVGLHPIPMRHGLTLGEMGEFINRFCLKSPCDFQVLPVKDWKREMTFFDTKLPYVLPSPNLGAPQSMWTFVATVLFEGTLLSEGRGTTRALEIIGHPKLSPYLFVEKFNKLMHSHKIQGVVLRPLFFRPTFQKHAGVTCGGFQLHVTDFNTFQPWKLGQILLRELKKELKEDFSWAKPPYEYVNDQLPIDVIQGTDQLRRWIEEEGEISELENIERQGREDFLKKRQECFLY